jgi:hypothetical protein
MLPYAVVQDSGFSAPETPKLNTHYLPDQDAVTITVECGQFTRKSNRIVISVMQDSQEHVVEQSAHHSDTDSSNSMVWATRSLFGLGIGNAGIADFPITAGEQITVHDVTAGDEVFIRTRNGPDEALQFVTRIENNTALPPSAVTGISEPSCAAIENETLPDSFWNKQYLIRFIHKQIPA